VFLEYFYTQAADDWSSQYFRVACFTSKLDLKALDPTLLSTVGKAALKLV